MGRYLGRGAHPQVVPKTISANLEATSSSWEPNNVHVMHVRLFSACAMSFVMFPCWQACSLSKGQERVTQACI